MLHRTLEHTGVLLLPRTRCLPVTTSIFAGQLRNQQQLKLTSTMAARRRPAAAAAANASKSSSTAPLKGPLPSGPSSFPRRTPLADPRSAGAYREKSTSSGSSSGQGGSSDKTASKDGQLSQSLTAAMARRLTRFYTANFERRPIITLW